MKRQPVMVFAGEFWAGASGRGLADGFRALGWAVQEVDYRDFAAKGGSGRISRAFARLNRTAAREALQRAVLGQCRVLKPDVLLAIKGVGLTSSLLRQVKETGARTAMYYPDVAFDHHGVSVDSFDEYDLFITTKTFQLAHLEHLLGRGRVAHVPHGYSDGVHRPVYSRIMEADYRADVLHAGNHSASKQRWIEGAVDAVPEATFHLVGNRWRENAAGRPLARCSALGERVAVSYAEAIQMARINIAVHMGPTASGWEDLVSTRTFEIPACGGFMLHIDNDEVREFFKPGVEIDVFSTPEELADKIRFYLTRPELRMQMIERAHARCVPAYGYAARAREIADILASRQGIRAT